MASRQARDPLAIRSTDSGRPPERPCFGDTPSPDWFVERRLERADGSVPKEEDAIHAPTQAFEVVRKEQRGDMLLTLGVTRCGHALVEQEQQLMSPRRQTDDARIGPAKAGDAMQQRGLARTARPDDPDSFADSDAKGHPAQHRDVHRASAHAGGVALPEIVNLERMRHAPRSHRRGRCASPARGRANESPAPAARSISAAWSGESERSRRRLVWARSAPDRSWAGRSPAARSPPLGAPRRRPDRRC